MFTPTYKDWPQRHRHLLHIVIVSTLLVLAFLSMVIYPRWCTLGAILGTVEEQRNKLEKSSAPQDARMLSAHIDECNALLTGSEDEMGLSRVTEETLAKATSNFTDEIVSMYYSSIGHGISPQDQFTANSTRIDYKDLYDRISSDFQEKGIVLNQSNIERDKDNTEPVFQLMLKLWTIRALLRSVVEQKLEIEKDEEGFARIHAGKVIGYYMGKEGSRPYLLEIPIRMRMAGTMEQFLKFAKSLQEHGQFLPVKNLTVYAEPPKDNVPPGGKCEISRLHFKVTCSSFFPAPSMGEQSAYTGNREN